MEKINDYYLVAVQYEGTEQFEAYQIKHTTLEKAQQHFQAAVELFTSLWADPEKAAKYSGKLATKVKIVKMSAQDIEERDCRTDINNTNN